MLSCVDCEKARGFHRQREECDVINESRTGLMPKIVVALLNEDQEFQQLQAQDAREAARRLGLELEVHFAQGHAVVQIQQLFKHIHAPEAERPLALVVEPAASEGLERVARNAVKAGVGWVLINSSAPYLDALRSDAPGAAARNGRQRPDGDRPDPGPPGDAARGQARAGAMRPGAGGIVDESGPLPGAQGDARAEHELRSLNGDWTEAGAERAVGSWLRLKTAESFRPDVVASQNDSMALGSKKALVKQHPDWGGVPLLGCDGLPQGGQKLVGQGQLAATIVTQSNTGPAIELLQRWLAEKKELPREVLIPPRSFPEVEKLTPRGPSASRG